MVIMDINGLSRSVDFSNQIRVKKWYDVSSDDKAEELDEIESDEI